MALIAALVAGLVVVPTAARSQELTATPALDWAVRAGGESASDQGLGVAADAVGNVYVTGVFKESATFGEDDGAVTLTGGAINNMFLASYSPDGELLWAVTAAGSGSSEGMGVAVDAEGNAVVTGTFSQSITFGAGDSAVTLDSTGADVFLAKYDPDGRLNWARRAGGSTPARGMDVTLDGVGNAVVTGWFSGEATFGEGAQAVTLLSQGGTDVFVASYDLNGALRWAVRAGGEHAIEAWGVGANGDHVVIQGFFDESATFGEGEGAVTLAAGSNTASFGNTFVASYTVDGGLNWAQRTFPVDPDGWVEGLGGVAVDALGNSYVTGVFAEQVTFGEGAEAITVQSAGWHDAYVASYRPDGTLRWVNTAGGPRSDLHIHSSGRAMAFGAAVDTDGNVSVTGFFLGSATFGVGDRAVTLGSDDLASSEAQTGLFVASYETGGLLRWAVQPISGDPASPCCPYGEGWGAAVDAAGNTVITGFFQGSATFGEGSQAVTLEAVGAGDMFVARYLPGGETPPPVEPVVTVTPSSGMVGTTFLVTGDGFTPDGTATIRLHRIDDGVNLPAEGVTADADGRFTHELITDDSWEPAAYLLWAVDDTTGVLSNPETFDVTPAPEEEPGPQAPPDPVPSDAPPGERDLTLEELAYRQALEDSAAQVAVHKKKQKLASVLQRLIGIDDHDVLRTGMHKTLGHTFGAATTPGDGTLCRDLLDRGHDSEALAVCGAGQLVAGEVGEDLIRTVGVAPLKAAARSYAGPLGDFSAAGRTTLSGVTVLAEVALSEDPGHEIGPALLKLIAVEVTARQLGKLMDDYLAHELASLSWNRIEQLLDREGLIMASLSGHPNVMAQGEITVQMSYAYNPWTHQVVVYTSYDQDPQDRLFVIMYEADDDGRAIGPPHCQTFTLDGRNRSC